MASTFSIFASFIFIVSVFGGDLSDVLTSLKTRGSCTQNVFLNNTSIKSVDNCSFGENAGKLNGRDYAKYLLCVAYYDMNMRLCNNLRLFEISPILRNATIFNKLISSEEFNKDFCNRINNVLATVTPFAGASGLILDLRNEFLAHEVMCHKICFDWDDTAVLPICKSIILGNLLINNSLSATKFSEQGSEITTNEEKIVKFNASKSASTVDSSNNKPASNKSVENTKQSDYVKSAETLQLQQPITNNATNVINSGNNSSTQEELKSNTNDKNLKSDMDKKNKEIDSGDLYKEAQVKSTQVKQAESNVPVIVNKQDVDDDTGDNTGIADLTEDNVPEDNSEELVNNVIPTPVQAKETPEIKEDPVINEPKGSLDFNEVKPEDKYVIENDMPSTHNKLVYSKDIYSSPSENHFYTVFFTVVVLSVIIYVVYHNKNKILALVIEGRNKGETRRSSSGPAYRRLDNLEQVVSSGVKTPPSNVIY